MTVRLLDEALINQIAAGEVVERPASVVKELVENALDAGATHVEVELKAGGRTLIAVVDNGAGMVRDDAMMALERHATSKIRTAHDLARVSSLGFRGEALPSIASVSRFELLTRPEGEEVGTRIRVEGGELRDVRDAGCAPGTEIRIRNLFFNVPVRRRFLRTAGTEVSHCLDAVVRQAMAHPRVGFRLRHESKVMLETPAVDTVIARVEQILGEDAKALAPTSFEADGILVEAYISPPGVSRSNSRTSSFHYVNGRFVRDRVLQRAVREAYRGRLAAGRHPIVVLRLRIDPLRVDVNVHPSKVEVRFREPRDVGHVVATGLRELLEELPGVVRNQPWQRRPEAPRSEALPFAAALPAHPDGVAVAPAGPIPAPQPLTPVLAADGPADQPSQPQSDEGPIRARVVGLLRGRLLLAEEGDDLLLIDVEAARSAVAAAELRRQPTALGGPLRLLVPKVFPMGSKLAKALDARALALLDHGVDLQIHGAGEILLKAAPAGLRGVDWAVFLPALAHAPDLVDALALAHAQAQEAPTDYARRALLAAIEELGLLDRLAHRMPIERLLGQG